MEAKVKVRLLKLIQEKERREERRITLVEVAEGSNVSLRLVHRWLKSSPALLDVNAIEGFCKYFNCDLPDLIYLDRGGELPDAKASG